MLVHKIERLKDFMPELLSALAEDHYQELADTSVPMDIDHKFYQALETAGAYLSMTVRDNGKLVGYMGYTLKTHPRYKLLFMAVADIFYLSKAYRKGWTGVKMIKAAEGFLKDRGVNRVVNHVKLKNDFGKVFEHLGYEPLERTYIKKI